VPVLREALLDVQYDLKEKADFPVLILIHGFDGAGRGETMNLINEWLDPRLIDTVAFSSANDEERARPWMWRYWQKLPAKGRIGMFLAPTIPMPCSTGCTSRSTMTPSTAKSSTSCGWNA
jgi:polyphosphate kinase 2 (PPK2 family)